MWGENLHPFFYDLGMALTEKQWSALRAEYISGDISIRKLAEKYNLSRRSVSRRATEGKWADARRNYREKVQSKFIEKSSDIEAADKALKLISLQQSADKMADVIQRVFDDTDQFNRYIISEGIGGGATQTEERTYSKVDTKAIKDLTSAMKDLTQVMRNLYDIPTLAERKAQQLAGERFQLEKRKQEAEENTDSTIKVVWEDAEEYSQ